VSKPTDESRRFPLLNRVDTLVVDNQLLGKSFMRGGTLARYRHGKIEYSMFVAKLIPSFGGYFGQDAGHPVFVFAKGAWIAASPASPRRMRTWPRALWPRI